MTDIPLQTSSKQYRTGATLLWWCGLFIFALLSQDCTRGHFDGRILLDTLDPHLRPCNASFECNNLEHTGRCINQICISAPRSSCEKPGDTRQCSISLQKGVCAKGNQECQPAPLTKRVWGDCLLQQSNQAPCATTSCQTGDVRECYPFDSGCRIDDKSRFLCFSPCRTGVQRCEDGAWGKCIDAVGPNKEVCNGQDDDCNGQTDTQENGTVLTAPCYSGPAQTRFVGRCHFGIKVCEKGKWGSCLAETTPSPEQCNAQDDDCNGYIDDNACPPGQICTGNQCQSTAPEPSRESTIRDAGPYQDAPTHADHPTSSESTSGEPPAPDGSTSEFTPEPTPERPPEPPPECISGDSRTCYTGTPNTQYRFPCKAGSQTCTPQGTWGACQGQRLPQAETCDGIDNNCDGLIDRTSTNQTLTRTCYSGANGTRGIGTCRDGVQLCHQNKWTNCVGDITPTKEVCNERDDDCNGKIDDTAACQ